MTTTRRKMPLAWLCGVGLLLTSLIGANSILSSAPNDNVKSSTDRSRDSMGVVCFGVVDTESGQIPLWPPITGQPSIVKKVPPTTREGNKVKAGDVLVEFDDEYARLQVKKAEAGLAEARGKLAEVRSKADQVVQGWKRMVAQQQAGLRAKEAELAIAETKVAGVEELFRKNFENKFTLQAAKDEVEARKQAVVAEREKLSMIVESKPDMESSVQQAEAAVTRYDALLAEAKYGLSLCVLTAKTDGTILRVSVTEGLAFGPQSKQPALIFLPKGPLIIRAEVEQEFAARVKLGQTASIIDDNNAAGRWSGKVSRISESYLPRRNSVYLPDPFQMNESRILECLITIDNPTTEAPLRIGQRLRVNLGKTE